MDYFNKKLIAAAKELAKQSQEISERLTSVHNELNKLEHAVRKASESGNEQEQVPSKVVAEAELPKGVEVRKGEPDATQEKKYQRGSLLVQGLALLAAVVVAVIYFSQLQVMQETMRVDQRPWVKLSVDGEPPRVGDIPSATVHITDFGKTPARNVFGSFVIKRVMLESLLNWNTLGSTWFCMSG